MLGGNKMKKIVYIVITFCVLLNSYIIYANENRTDILKKELNILNINNPNIDLTKNIDINNFRFIGLYGYVQYSPGIDEKDHELIKKYGSFMFRGTSDSIESEEHGELIQKARQYAEIYNTSLLNYLKKHNVKPMNGYVPDEETAIRIAIAVWVPIYGEKKIEKEKPYNAILKDGVWYVLGSLPKGYRGGVAEAEIIKESGKIIRISHGK